MVIKITFEGEVKRVYEETRGTRVNKYVVATDGREQYPNVLRFKMKPGTTVAANVGDNVRIEAYLDGREWTPTDGRDPMYFTDLTISALEVMKSAAGGGKPTNANNWKELVALGAAYGEDENAVKERCKAYGKPFKAMSVADWQELARRIVADATSVSAGAEVDGGTDETFGDEDEMPF